MAKKSVDMKTKKSIQLTTKSLEELLAKGESIDFRLDEDSWRDLDEGSLIEFWEDFTGWDKEPAENARKVVVKIEKVYKAPTFREVFDLIENDLSLLGDKDDLLSGLRDWWSEDKESDEGVLAWHVIVEKELV